MLGAGRVEATASPAVSVPATKKAKRNAATGPCAAPEQHYAGVNPLHVPVSSQNDACRTNGSSSFDHYVGLAPAHSGGARRWVPISRSASTAACPMSCLAPMFSETSSRVTHRTANDVYRTFEHAGEPRREYPYRKDARALWIIRIHTGCSVRT
jgi:hypothetical protein